MLLLHEGREFIGEEESGGGMEVKTYKMVRERSWY